MNQIFHRNQYKILIVPIEETNIIYVQSFILSGRMNENKKTSGISHLLEHILTESWKKCKDDCAKYWGNKGIITNASTGDTTINYYVEGLEKNYKELIEYIVKITTTPQFKESRIEVEKKAVREELNRELTDEGWKIADKVSKLLYNHEGLQSSNDLPLQIKNLKHLDKEILINYCEKIYTPKNILFIVSGDVNKNKILKVFEKFLPKKSSFGTKNIQCNVFNDIKKPITHFLKKKNAKTAEIIMAFASKIYPWEEDYFYFDILVDLLSGGMHSLLMRRLRTELHLVYNVKVYLESEIIGTLATIETTGDQGKTKLIIKSIKSVLKDLIKGNWSEDHITRLKDKFFIRDEKVCKNNIFFGDFYGEQYLYQLYKEKPKITTTKQKRKLIKNLTKKKLINIAKRVFPMNKMITLYQCQTKQH